MVMVLGLYVTMPSISLKMVLYSLTILTVRVFDILHLNGECLINYALQDRRTALERSVKTVGRRLEVHGYEVAREAVEIERALRKVISEASEGLVIKVCPSLGLIECESMILTYKLKEPKKCVSS